MKARRNDYLQPASRVVPVRLRGILMSSGTSEQSETGNETVGPEWEKSEANQELY